MNEKNQLSMKICLNFPKFCCHVAAFGVDARSALIILALSQSEENAENLLRCVRDVRAVLNSKRSRRSGGADVLGQLQVEI